VQFALTILVFADVIISWVTRFAKTCFVVRPDSELINLLLFKTFDLGLASSVGSFKDLDPIGRQFILHLHCVVSEWATAVSIGLSPLQADALVVVIEDIGFARTSRLI
jgi:hypothetical protein